MDKPDASPRQHPHGISGLVTSAPVSVIIPCFRCASTIERALISVAQQSYRPAEIILVDDASGDGTLDKLRELQRHYGSAWLHVIELPQNGGPAAARNAAWDASTQPYLAFLDADDSWHPQKLELQLAYMLAHPDVVITGHGWTSANGKAHAVSSHPPVYHVTYKKMLFSNRLLTPTVMLKRCLPFRFGAWQRRSEDYLLWLGILASGRQGRFIGAELAYLYKAPYGEGGLSGRLWEMEKGELSTYRYLYQTRLLSLAGFLGVGSFSLLKYLKRVLTVAWKRSWWQRRGKEQNRKRGTV